MNDTPSPDEVTALVREYDSVAAEHVASPEGSRAGCLVSLLAIFALFAVPGANRALGLGLTWRFVRGFALSMLALAFLAAMFHLLAGVLAARGQATQRALDALDHLSQQFDEGSDAQNRRAAVTLLVDAFITGGATTVAAFDFNEAKARLGPALPYVQEIERVLREERQIYPVFTS